MNQFLVRIKTLRTFALIDVIALLLSFHFFFIYFTNSSFLAQYTTKTGVGLIYAASALINVLLFLFISPILRRLGNYKLMLALLFTELICMWGLGLSTNFNLIVFFFIVSLAAASLLVFNLDLFLESLSSNRRTGSIRGIFMASMSVPPIITPAIVGFILTTSDYWKTYLVASLFLLPVIYLVSTHFKSFADPHYPKATGLNALPALLKNKDIFDIIVDNFLLNFFYCWMSIYMPIYLHTVIGFDWPHIGIMFSIMLLPFLLFEIPLGRLADEKIGEKEILIFGFCIISIATIMIPYLTSADFFLWTLLLFITRVGASFIEIGAETYFFKKVGAKDVNLIATFRMLKDLPYVIIPPLAVAAFVLVDFKFTFLLLGLTMLIGLRYTFDLKDTR